jgi:hypothetical protein
MICNLPLEPRKEKKRKKKEGQAHGLSISWVKCTSLTKPTP